MDPDKRTNNILIDPLPPDQAGYCYRNQVHFNEFMQKISHRLIRKHGSFFDRLPLWGMFVFFAVVIIVSILTSSFPPSGWILLPQIVSLLIVAWYYFRIWRFIKTIIRKRMCFKCGYVLRHSPTDSAGFGKCSECGLEFNLGYYCHLPHDYKRPEREPDWRESLHPLDRVRMERDESQTTNI